MSWAELDVLSLADPDFVYLELNQLTLAKDRLRGLADRRLEGPVKQRITRWSSGVRDALKYQLPAIFIFDVVRFHR